MNMYNYNLEVRLAKSNSDLDFCNKEAFIKKCISEYNNTSYQMNNPKKLQFVRIENNKLYLNLQSLSKLNFVGKSLRTFSMLLLQDEDFSNSVSPNGQLIRAVQLSCDEDDVPLMPVSAENVDDLTFIKSLLDYLYNPRDLNTTIYKRKKSAFEQMKQIALEAGFIEKNK